MPTPHTVLGCWEMGAGMGHIDRMLVWARALREQGHSVQFALRDLARTFQRLSVEGFAVGQCPVWLPTLANAPRLGNYSSVLAAAGWLDPQGLAALVRAWQLLFKQSGTQLVVVDHAPTALLAAKLAGVEAWAVGNSFEVPPAGNPFPPMAWWNPQMAPLCASWDATLLPVLNEALRLLGHSPWQRLTELFDGTRRLVLQIPELTHYPVYDSAAEFAGPVYLGDSGALPQWPQAEGPKVFAYLSPKHAQFEALMKALQQQGCVSLVHAKGLSAEAAQRLGGARLRFEPQPVQMDAAAAQADLVITHASLGTVTAAALAGKPQLGLPNHMEQWMTGRRMVEQGLGLIVDLGDPKPDVAGLLRRLLSEPQFSQASRAMAARCGDWRPAQTGQRVAALMQAHFDRQASPSA